MNNESGIPKISIFLPIYNKEKYLKRSITSIQRQTLKNIEIITINDCSTDNSLKILKEFAEKDSRIKIINNKKNSGLLFSRAMGILNSKSEYLMNLDPDDEFKGSRNLKYLYNKAKRFNLDMISFLILYLPENSKIGQYPISNRKMYQPDLFKKAFYYNAIKDFYVTNKLVKNEIYKKAYNFFKHKIYENKWNYHEDNIWSILLYKYSSSSIFINKVIYYYYQNKESIIMNKGNILELKNLLYRYEMYTKIFNSKKDEKYLIVGYYELFNKFEKNLNIIKQNNQIKNQFLNKTDNLINNYNISREMLNKINNFVNRINS